MTFVSSILYQGNETGLSVECWIATWLCKDITCAICQLSNPKLLRFVHRYQSVWSAVIQCASQGIVSGREAPAGAADTGAASVTNKLLCDEECLAKLENLQTEETKTGLKYKDIVVGKGPSPPTGYQVRQRSFRLSNAHQLCLGSKVFLGS